MSRNTPLGIVRTVLFDTVTFPGADALDVRVQLADIIHSLEVGTTQTLLLITPMKVDQCDEEKEFAA